jgi:hypothetical protein
MPKYYPPKRPTKKQVMMAMDIYRTANAKTQAEIDAMPDDQTPKQRKKRVEIESDLHSYIVTQAVKKWPGLYIFSNRDERGMYAESERNKQAGKKRPDIFVAKSKVLRLACKCDPPLIYSTLETHCHTCMKRIRAKDKLFCGAFIELKADPGKYLTLKGEIREDLHTRGQFQTLLNLRSEGYFACFAGGYDEAWGTLTWYMEGEGLPPFEYLYT